MSSVRTDVGVVGDKYVDKYKVEDVKVPFFCEPGIWRYIVTNLETGKETKYTLFVALNTLEDPGDIPEVIDAVNSKGRSLVQNWLARRIEEERVAVVGRMGIKEFTKPQWDIHSKNPV